MSATADDRALLGALHAYAAEDRRSVFHVVTTALLLVSLEATTLFGRWLPLRLAASLLLGLTLVRGFVLFHDFMHGALLRGSRPASAPFHLFGLVVMVPPRVWRETHDYHHAHTAKIIGSNIGSFPVVTTGMWARMNRGHRVAYRLARHPLTILFAYFTVFLLGMGVRPFLRAPRKHLEAGLTAFVHLAAWASAVYFGVFGAFLLSFGLPVMLASALGAYLFYAQHNFPGIHVQPRESWSYARAALESSSFMKMGPLMRYFTGDIGYHHVHHVHPRVPFYRLEEAMLAVPALGNVVRISLHPVDVRACLRLKVWDQAHGRMVGYPREASPDQG